MNFYAILFSAVAVRTVLVLFENRMRHLAVRDDLNRAVVVVELLGGYDVRVVPMHASVDANDALDETRNRTQIVRHHHDGHTFVEPAQQRIQLVLEFVVDEVGRLVENQQLRVGYYRTAYLCRKPLLFCSPDNTTSRTDMGKALSMVVICGM